MAKTAQELSNEKYRELCTQYGDLHVQMGLLKKNLESVEKAIEHLNATVPTLVEFERGMTKFFEPVITPPTKIEVQNLVDSPTPQKVKGT